MKKIIFILLLIFTSFSFGQFREELDKPVDISAGIINNTPSGFLLGFINPENFRMSHSFNMSYTTFGNHGISLGVYTNSMSYAFNEQLNFEVDASIINTPYNTFGDNFTNSINGIYLSRAQLNYKAADNFFISLQYRNTPYGYYSPWDNYRFRP